MCSLPDDDEGEGETPPNGYIHFDRQGKLWYRQHGQRKWSRWPTNLLIYTYERLISRQNEQCSTFGSGTSWARYTRKSLVVSVGRNQHTKPLSD